MDFTCLKEFMDRLTDWRIPGNSVSVWHDGREVFRYSSGFSNLEDKIPMNGSELLNIYSTSKVCTVTAALQLYERGFFLLDDPVSEFIPEFGEMYVRENGEIRKAENRITMRNLFTMTSGLTYNMNTDAFRKARELTDGRMETLQVIKCLASDPLAFEPGERWNYSLSHDVLAAVVEVISGRKFRYYVKENIFDPLEMNDSFYHNDAVRDRMAEQYRYVDDRTDCDAVKAQFSGIGADGAIVNEGKENCFVFGSEYDSGGAGITTTVGDYAKFAQALALKGKGVNGERILSEGTVDLLRSNQLTEQQKKYFDWESVRGYGYGLGVKVLENRGLSGSTGTLGGFSWGGAAGATILADPDEKLSVFYAHHMLNPQETYYQPRLRNVLYTCFKR